MGGKWPYNCCFVRCCFQDFFYVTHCILMQFWSSFFFSLRSVSEHVVHLYYSIDTTVAWKIFHFNLLDRLDFQMVKSLSIAVQAFAWQVKKPGIFENYESLKNLTIHCDNQSSIVSAKKSVVHHIDIKFQFIRQCQCTQDRIYGL